MPEIDYGVKPTQDALLEILLEADRICRKYDIDYSLIFGSMIGAIRHSGFIPWDDDADIAFTRENFDRFIQHADELDPKFQLVFPNALPNKFFDNVTRIIYKGVFTGPKTENSAFYEELHNQAALDLFILDETPGGKKVNRQWFALKKRYAMAMGYRPQITYSRFDSFFVRFAARVLSKWGRLHRLDRLMAKMDAVSRKYNGQNCEYYCYFTGYPACSQRILTPARLCKKYIEVDCCGHKLKCFADYDEMMTIIYGDWRKLPPEEDRHPTHCDCAL